MDEYQLILGLKKNCSVATDKLVNLYGDRLLGSAYLLCGNDSTAQDLVQDTFIQVLLSIKKFKMKSTLYTWMYGILLNKYRELYRKQKKAIFLPLLFDRELQNDSHFGEIDSNYLQKALQNLPFKHRQIIILRYYEDMQIDEIAICLNINKGTVKSRLHYATQKLRNVLTRKEK
ncbi:RNA polymerase sigma factor [Candidatus Uabimicrobium sp. HlEnr_7]|uniref:RNA polymerase sigma factor n=1 Tax=Candidatus Uabimicrobium helgolandensis TaxID=3095367 RepID=UPI003558E8F9